MPSGNLYVTDNANGRVRKIDKQGIITTIAGSGGSDLLGDGGLATDAVLTSPAGLAFDAEGNLYVATIRVSSIYHYGRVWKINKNVIVTTVAGTDTVDLSGDGGPGDIGRDRQSLGDRLRRRRESVHGQITETTVCAGWTRTESSRLLPEARPSRPR